MHNPFEFSWLTDSEYEAFLTLRFDEFDPDDDD